MSLISTPPLPAHSRLWTHHREGDFLDCYSCASDLSPQEALGPAFAMPGWVQMLMRLRNALVAPLGLKTGSASREEDTAIFPITHETEDELLMGTDDRHLDFRIAVLRHQGRIFVSTWVHPHNWLGRAYLALVMPFHVMIVRGSVKRVARSSQPAG